MGDSNKKVKTHNDDSCKKTRKLSGAGSNSSKRKKNDSGRKKEETKKQSRCKKSKNRKKKSGDKKDREHRKTIEESTDMTILKFNRDFPESAEQKQVFINFIRESLAKGVNGIMTEYTRDLTQYVPPNITRKHFDLHPHKNRYSDVICIDQTRVRLHPNEGYIHANYIRGDPLINVFICTQGPMVDTIYDFWKMVYQERVTNIIMLCDTVEAGREKCQQYWPREEGCGMEIPGFYIRNCKSDNLDPAFRTSQLLLENTIENEKYSVAHHHWRSWPDKSLPHAEKAILRLLGHVRHSGYPTVVHCSAGIGRTGSIVAIEICLQQLLMENALNVLDMVKWLRGQRMHAVQNDLQYLYLYICIFTHAAKYGLITQDMQADWEKFYSDYRRVVNDRIKVDLPHKYAPLNLILPSSPNIPSPHTPTQPQIHPPHQ